MTYTSKSLAPLFKDIDLKEMKTFLTAFSAFRTRYYRSETGKVSHSPLFRSFIRSLTPFNTYSKVNSSFSRPSRTYVPHSLGFKEAELTPPLPLNRSPRPTQSSPSPSPSSLTRGDRTLLSFALSPRLLLLAIRRRTRSSSLEVGARSRSSRRVLLISSLLQQLTRTLPTYFPSFRPPELVCSLSRAAPSSHRARLDLADPPVARNRR